MIVAVTGGTGFIGRHLIARHCSRGDQVRYLTRKQPTGAIAGATAFIGSLSSSPDQLREFARGADVLYHCAAELRDESAMQRTNVLGTAQLLAAATGEIGRWVQLSSTGVYGRQVSGVVDEETLVNPANAYEVSKAMADAIVLDTAGKQGLACVVVRPSNVYGPNMPNQSLLQLIRMIDRRRFFFIGRRGAIVNYVHVENVVDALILCGQTALPGNGRAYIVSDHCGLDEFVHLITTALGKAPPRLRLPERVVRAVATAAGGIPGFPLTPSRIDALTGRAVFCANRIRTELGFRNTISMEAGISDLARRCCAWTDGP
ncbi:MAG: NAD-dependent epimerase/dehydratase family protein [Betaproteobacteria bacterium]